MGQKNFDEGAPLRQCGGESGAGWAMVCAAECHEGLENWDLAEEMMQATAQRYADSRLDWFFWCCRTGHGHIDDARRLAMQTAPQLSLSPNYEDWDHLGIYHLLCGKSELARKTFAKAFEKSGHPYSALHAALLEDEAHNSEARDKLLVTAVDRGEKLQGSGNPPTNFIEFTKWLNNAYHQPVMRSPTSRPWTKSSKRPTSMIRRTSAITPAGIATITAATTWPAFISKNRWRPRSRSGTSRRRPCCCAN